MTEHKGFDPSKRKLDQARREGNVLKSPLFTQGVVLVVCYSVALWGLGSIFLENRFLLQCYNLQGVDSPLDYFKSALLLALGVSLMIIVPGVVAAILVEGLQVGFKFEASILAPKFERLNPASGLGRIWQGLVGSWEGIVRVAVAALAFTFLIKMMLPDMVALVGEPVEGVVEVAVTYLTRFLMVTIGLILSLAALEFGVKRKQFMSELSMSLDEVRREHKEDEGDPMLKSVRKQLHESLSREDLISRVRRSKVIVVEKADGK